jgi:hypothetical protein
MQQRQDKIGFGKAVSACLCGLRCQRSDAYCYWPHAHYLAKNIVMGEVFLYIGDESCSYNAYKFKKFFYRAIFRNFKKGKVMGS